MTVVMMLGTMMVTVMVSDHEDDDNGDRRLVTFQKSGTAPRSPENMFPTSVPRLGAGVRSCHGWLAGARV